MMMVMTMMMMIIIIIIIIICSVSHKIPLLSLSLSLSLSLQTAADWYRSIFSCKSGSILHKILFSFFVFKRMATVVQFGTSNRHELRKVCLCGL